MPRRWEDWGRGPYSRRAWTGGYCLAGHGGLLNVLCEEWFQSSVCRKWISLVVLDGGYRMALCMGPWLRMGIETARKCGDVSHEG